MDPATFCKCHGSVLTFTPDVWKGLLTKKFIDLIKQADDGVLDLNKAADTLNVSHCELVLALADWDSDRLRGLADVSVYFGVSFTSVVQFM